MHCLRCYCGYCYCTHRCHVTNDCCVAKNGAFNSWKEDGNFVVVAFKDVAVALVSAACSTSAYYTIHIYTANVQVRTPVISLLLPIHFMRCGNLRKIGRTGSMLHVVSSSSLSVLPPSRCAATAIISGTTCMCLGVCAAGLICMSSNLFASFAFLPFQLLLLLSCSSYHSCCCCCCCVL